MPNFIHLHAHSEYSILDGVAKIPAYIGKVKEHGMNAAALTDHGNMYGSFEFWQECKNQGIKPIIGCEVYVAKRTRFDKTPGIDDKRYHLTLLAKNKTGYHNLLKIVSKAFVEGFYYKPRVDRELLSKYGEGVIALSGCLGSNFNQYLMSGDEKQAISWIKFLQESCTDVYIELQRNGIPEAHDLVPKQVEIAKKLNIPYVATCDTHYIEREDHNVQEIVWCISDGKKLDDPTRRQYGSTEFYIKSPQELVDAFPDYPEALENTQLLADSVEEYNVMFERVQPKYDTKLASDKTQKKLRENVMAKLKNRYPKLTTELQERIDYELEVIHDKGYDDYFLVVEDYVDWARSQNILVGPGRGSGAGSVVAYILGITDLDPFQFDLIFERFLNPERPSPPDFDIDFQDDRRDELFRYMSEKYGHENTSFIGTFGRLKTKAAIRDVARVMGIDLQIADRLSKMVIVKFGRVHSMEKMREEVKEFDEIIKGSSELEELAKYVSKLENLARHVSIHACGYLVTPTPITDYVAIQKEVKGDKHITQVEGHNIEYLGLMKFDFLGLSNLTVIQNTLKQIKNSQGKIIEMNKLALDDKKTYELFQKGDTTGIFQFESEGMKKYLRDLKPTQFEDLIFLNAAYRPGPMKYIPDYILRKEGKQKVDYLHPSLEPILKPTFGFAIYQEQVINIAVKFANYSLGEADMLRRAMGKKKPEVMAKEKELFFERAIKNNQDKEIAEKIFSYLEPFADYGFNKSHSAAYSMIAYQTGYLKAHYPLEFMAGLMETDINAIDKLERDLKEAKNIGIKLLPPDINKSMSDFKIEGKKSIRFGLAGIKNVSSKSIDNIISARSKDGEFENLDHLITQVGTEKLTKKDLENLIKVGALDNFGSRIQLLEIMPLVYAKVRKTEEAMQGGQAMLFGAVQDNKTVPATPLPNLPKESDTERLNWERELLGIYLSKHPIDKYSKTIFLNKFKTLSKISKLQSGTKVKTIVLLSKIKKIYTKKGARAMAFVEFEDSSGKVSGVVFPDTYEQIGNSLLENSVVFVQGTTNIRNDEFSIILEDVASADEIKSQNSMTIDISREKDKNRLQAIKDGIMQNPGNIKLTIFYGDSNIKKSIEKKVNLTSEFIAILKDYIQSEQQF